MPRLVWLADLKKGWVGRDPSAVASLFTEEVEYHSSPFHPPITGRQAITEHWRNEVAGDRTFDVEFHSPVIDGNDMAVRWTLTEYVGPDVAVAEVGALFLEFSGDRCCRLAEYWMLAEESPTEPVSLRAHSPG